MQLIIKLKLFTLNIYIHLYSFPSYRLLKNHQWKTTVNNFNITLVYHFIKFTLYFFCIFLHFFILKFFFSLIFNIYMYRCEMSATLSNFSARPAICVSQLIGWDEGWYEWFLWCIDLAGSENNDSKSLRMEFRKSTVKELALSPDIFCINFI